MVMEQAGVEESPGILPAVNVVRHVTPMKSPPAAKAPSVTTEIMDYKFNLHINFQDFIIQANITQSTCMTIIELLNIAHYLITSIPVAVLPG